MYSIIIVTPNLSTNIIPTKSARLRLSGKLPADTRIPPLNINIMLESNPPESRFCRYDGRGGPSGLWRNTRAIAGLRAKRGLFEPLSPAGAGVVSII